MAGRPAWAGAFIRDSYCQEILPQGALRRLAAGQGDAMHYAPMAVVVVDGIVLAAAVVPERERAGAPLEAAGEFRLHLVAEQELQQRRALFLGHAGKARGVRGVDIQRLAPGLRMRAHHGVLREVVLAFAALFLDTVFARARDIC